jgi:hypothetical protein
MTIMSFTGAVENYSIAQTNDGYEIITMKQEEKKEVEKPKQEVKEITKKEEYPKFVSRGLPRGISGEMKCWMDYRTITNKQSEQYKLQKKATTDNNGLRRYNYQDESYYMIAVGTFYSEKVGKRLKITLDNDGKENVIYCIVGDIKQDRHTNETNQYVISSKNIIEFIVRDDKLSSMCKKMGDVSYADESLVGSIVKIEEIKD